MNGNILLITRYGGWGDLVMLLPTIKALRTKYAGYKVVLRTYKDYENFLKPSALIDQVVLDDNTFKLFPAEQGHTILNEKTSFGEAGDVVTHYNFQGTIEARNDVHGVFAFAYHAGINLVWNGTYEHGLFTCYNFKPQSPSIVVQTREKGDGRDLTSKDLPYETLVKLGAFFINAPLPHEDFVDLIANCRLFIGPDSSGLHIAAASSVPHIIGLYTDKFPPKIRSYAGVHAYTKVEELKPDIEKLLKS